MQSHHLKKGHKESEEPKLTLIKQIYSKKMNEEAAYEIALNNGEDYHAFHILYSDFFKQILKNNAKNWILKSNHTQNTEQLDHKIDLNGIKTYYHNVTGLGQIIKKMMEDSLKILLNNPRSYNAWNLRRNITSLSLHESELALVKECFEMDPRLFHCWNHVKHIRSLVNDRVKIKLDEIVKSIVNEDFGNYGAIYDLMVNNIEIDNLLSKLYTDPLDEGLWKYVEYDFLKKYLKDKPFYLRIYEDYFVVIGRSCLVHVNGILLKSCTKYNPEYKRYIVKIKIGDKISIDDVDLSFEGLKQVCPRFLDDLVELAYGCSFGWLFKLSFVDDMNMRRIIVDRLAEIDPNRAGYYGYLIDKYYYIL